MNSGLAEAIGPALVTPTPRAALRPIEIRTPPRAHTDSCTQTMTFLLMEGMSMMSLIAAIEPLRSLNRLLGTEAWRWRLASLDGGCITATNGIPLPTEPLEAALADSHYLFVCGGLRIQPIDEKRYLGSLRRAARHGIKVGALSTGTHLLARAGLLDGYRCTIHWENLAAFREEFPHVVCTEKVYEIDRDRLTCCGGVASMDLMLHLIEGRQGRLLARRVANQFLHDRIREAHDVQGGGRTERLVTAPPLVRDAIDEMRRHTEDTVSIAQIAAACGTSVRQLERLFVRHLDVTPARHYLSMRIERARELLIYSDLSIVEIAVATGFTSASHFALWFKRLLGVRPSQLRRRTPKATAHAATG